MLAEAVMASPSGENTNSDAAQQEVLEAKVVVLCPPRPDALLTYLPTADAIPGVQTLLYSLHKTMMGGEKKNQQRRYPPEVVLMVTEQSALATLPQVQNLCPDLCTRIVTVDEWKAPEHTIDDNFVTTENRVMESARKRPLGPDGDWSRLRAFGLQQYDTIVFLNCDCLVVKDVTSLLDLGKNYTESKALVAAAPGIVPPDQFDAGVMVIRPSREVVSSMLQHEALRTTHGDGSDAAFLNAYYPQWFTEFPPHARLAVGYNAQQILYDMTIDENNKSGDTVAPAEKDHCSLRHETTKHCSAFWELQIAPNLHVVHYSNVVKPWETPPGKDRGHNFDSLQTLFWTWYKKSQNYLARMAQKRRQDERLQRQKDEELLREQMAQRDAKAQAMAWQLQQQGYSAAPSPPQPSRTESAQIHKIVTRRFKELRSQGKSSKEAMTQAREEMGQSDEIETDASSQVAAMFGI